MRQQQYRKGYACDELANGVKSIQEFRKIKKICNTGGKMNLQTKTLYADTLDELCTIKKDCGMAFDGTQRLKDAVDTMPLLVPVVGEFSAGKSTMLNKLIGRDMLAVSMKPETAIPAELYYSLEEYDEGVYADGRTERIGDVSQAA